MTTIIDQIKRILPIYPGTAEPEAKLPYAVYSERQDPVVTFDGIAGYDDTLNIALFAATKSKAEALRDELVALLNGKTLGASTLYYAGSDYTDYHDQKISSYELTFNLLR